MTCFPIREPSIDALRHARGATVHRVECREIEREEPDKFVCRSRTILWSLDAPAIVRRCLETADESLRDAARAAARAAAKAAAWDASWEAANSRLTAAIEAAHMKEAAHA